MLLSKLYVDSDVLNDPLTEKICSRLKVPYELIHNRANFFRKIKNIRNIVSHGKKVLFLTRNRGYFLKKCPGTRYYTCCNYFILHIGSFCFMDCSYCILQTYFHPPIMQFFVNYDKLEDELDELFHRDNICRVGTGEFTDSLIWEKATGISRLLIEKFSTQSRSVLELKTKTVNINNFRKLIHNRKTILSWSLNTPKIIESEERHTVSLDARLRAASKCESWGYPLAFHFDPMIIYDGCKKDYQSVVEALFRSVSPRNIVWISMGMFRFIPSLKPMIQKRFSSSKIIYGEFINGIDGKMRYFKLLRVELYKHMVETIREIAPDVCIYFCMEDNDIWERTTGITFDNNHGLARILDRAAKEKCNLRT